jgi:RNase_H superfamily
MIVTSWSLWEPRLSHENIIKETSILCVSWKEVGKSAIPSVAVNVKKVNDDYEVCRVTRDALLEADVLVHHNGDSFDLPILNARLLKHGLKPLPLIPTIDTKKVAKAKFRFDSNRLDYLADYLGIGRKKQTNYGLWLKIMQGNAKALDYMVRYNKHDVALNEKVYEFLRPFMTSHPNQRLYSSMSDCPICGKGPLTSQGYRYTRTTKRQRFQCKACGGWSQGETRERTKVS